MVLTLLVFFVMYEQQLSALVSTAWYGILFIGYSSTCHAVKSSHGHLVTRLTRRRSTRHIMHRVV